MSAAERTILGAILLDSAAFSEASQLGLKAKEFSLDSDRIIYARMLELAESSRPIDMITLVEELARHKQLELIGGPAYISSLVAGLPERPSIAAYISMVRDAAARRFAAKQLENATLALADPRTSINALREMGSALAQIPEGAILPPEFSEDALALRFSRKYADDLRYCHVWGKWSRWDGVRWLNDTTLHVYDLARGICREVGAECGDSRAARLASKYTVSSVERFAAADRRHASTVEQWDSDAWLLNTSRGTIDLRTGELREHNRSDYLTKCTNAAPDDGPNGCCELWAQFLAQITRGDPELQKFLARMVGYCLTGVTREHALFFLYGTGANGKSVFVSTIHELLGDYARISPIELIMADSGNQHPTGLAGLHGARFVTSTETEDGGRWAEQRLKSLTGGEPVTARYMRGDYFDFRPTFKLLISGNYKPGLRTVDEAIRRRLHLVPFAYTVPENDRDPKLAEKLRSELPGILRWAVEGCLEWQRVGLNPPQVVRDATANYLIGEDALGRWLEERCLPQRTAWTPSSELSADWNSWCQANGETSGPRNWLGKRLEARGFTARRSNGSRGFAGLALQTRVTLASGLNVTSPGVQ